MRNGKKALALALSVAVGLGGCARPAPEAAPSPSAAPTPAPTAAVVEKERPLTLAYYPAGGFHPIDGNSRINLTLSPLLYQGLFAVDGQFRAVEELCERYSVSENGLVWTFYLRQASFSDGSPLTGAEVAASLERARKSERYRGRLKDISRVTAGEGSVTVTLSRPNGALPRLLDVPVFKETGDPQRPLGTGRYYLAEGDGGLRLEAREGAAVPAASIPLRGVTSGDDLVYAFDAQEVTLVDTDLTGTNALGFSGRFEVTDHPSSTLLYVGCNTKSGACRDARVRQALLRAFDREGITRRLLDRHAVAAALPVHPWTEEYDQELAESLGQDTQAARELLELAGWSPDEEGRLRQGRRALSLRLIVNQENIYKVTVAENLADTLRELGCDVTLSKLPWEKFTAALRGGEFDLYLGETVMTVDFDPEALLAGELNYGGFSDGQTNELMGRYRAAAGEARAAAGSELWTRVAELAPILPLCFKNGSLLTQWGQLSGLQPTQRNVFAGMENWTAGRS